MRTLTLAAAILCIALIGGVAAQPPTDVEAPYPLVAIEIPRQTMSGWYERGDVEGEAHELQAYLRTLIWGENVMDQQAAMAEGQVIEVNSQSGEVFARLSDENIQRIDRELSPSMEATLRHRILDQGGGGAQVSSTTFTAPPTAGAGIISRRPVESTSTGTSSEPRRTARLTFRSDDSRTFNGLRITLLDVFVDSDSPTTIDDDTGETTTRASAIFLLETTHSTTEVTIVELRSVTFENFRIRLEEAGIDDGQRAAVEVTDLSIQ